MYQIFTVDAFTNKPFMGNPAGVVPFADGLSSELMLKLAKEINLSDTAFLLKPDHPSSHFKVRYFTRGEEIDFCGHATIALSWVLGSIYDYMNKTKQLILETNIGIVTVDFETVGGMLKTVVMKQVTPQVKEFEDTKSLFTILGLQESDYDINYPIKLAYTGNWHLMVPVKTKEALIHATPDFNALRTHNKKHKISTTHLFTFDTDKKEVLMVARDFAPSVDVDEDPVTGSANGALAGYLVLENKLPQNNEYKIHQINQLKRLGELTVKTSLENNNVIIRVGGSAVIMMKGTIDL